MVNVVTHKFIFVGWGKESYTEICPKNEVGREYCLHDFREVGGRSCLLDEDDDGTAADAEAKAAMDNTQLR